MTMLFPKLPRTLEPCVLAKRVSDTMVLFSTELSQASCCKVEILRPEKVTEENQFTVKNLKMKTSTSDTPSLAC